MKLSIAILIALILVQAATPVVGGGKSRRCYKKTRVCCWRFSVCGGHKSKKKFIKRCSYKRCKPSCYKSCHKVRVQSKPKKYCYYAPCDHCGRGRKICKIKRGRSHYVRRCVKRCAKKCYNVHANCVYYKIYVAKRFCAKARCGRESKSGYTRKPKSFTRSPEFVKKVFSHREERKRRHY